MEGVCRPKRARQEGGVRPPSVSQNCRSPGQHQAAEEEEENFVREPTAATPVSPIQGLATQAEGFQQ